ncbi:hypothetical protein BDN72DRAFT_594810 [Pluteus cervinus]|uniref:Uncharacterized protein n=1 Tax=Pluteus cervinus TaxID=181527 RepID=A0ACD3AWA6_9AGAR|nr:hypothetical protein BDN72DRAFT_594810 [Pluteus cervinus]
MRYIRFLWHFPCFVFIGLPYYFILNFFQTSRYTYAFRTPIADWHHDDQWYTEGSGGQRKPLGLRERLRRWEEMNWCRQHTISVAVLVSILVLVFAWILYRYL